MEELLKAVYTGDLDKVKELVREGFDLTGVDNKGWMVLHHVTKSGFVDIAEYLVEKGVDVNCRITGGGQDCHGTPLLISCKEDNTDMVKYLIEHGADIKDRDKDNRNVLHYACESNNLDAVEYLVSKGADVNCKDEYKDFPLSIAWSKGNMDIVKYLIEHGADVNARGRWGGNVLHNACESNNLDLVEYLVSNGADVNCKDEYEDFPLSIAWSKGNMDMVKYLIQHGADINTSYNWGLKVLLHCACKSKDRNIVECLVQNAAYFNRNDTLLLMSGREGNVDMVKYLVEHGANINAIGSRGLTVLGYAFESQNMELAAYLICRGADVNCKIPGTPQLISFSEGFMELMKSLIEHGADINDRDKWAGNVLYFVCKSNSLDFVEYLVSKGADVNCKDGCKDTPLSISCSKGNMDMVRFLIEHGADIDNKDSLLLMSCETGNLVYVQFMLRNGADINTTDKESRSLLYYAERSSNRKLIEYLESLGVGEDNKVGLVAELFGKALPSLGSEITTASITATRAKVTFDRPSSRNFDTYKVRVHPSANGEKATNIPKDAAFPSSGLSNLVPDTEYTVAISVVKGTRRGPLKISIFTTSSSDTAESDDERSCYKIDTDPRGLCIIINNRKFGGDGSRDRLGSDVDERKLQEIFTKLKFRIQTHRDLEAERIIGVVKKVADTDHSNFDCLVFCILSHGKKGQISGTDEQLVEISNITFHFKGANCPTLKAKPKLFFIQACQGGECQAGFKMQADSVGASLTLSNEADFLIGYATVPEYVSYRTENEGSWYIGALVEMLERYCDKEDLLSIMTRVTNEVCKKGYEDMKQCPTPYTTLCKKVFLKRY